MSTGRVLYSPSSGRVIYSPTSGRALYSGVQVTPFPTSKLPTRLFSAVGDYDTGNLGRARTKSDCWPQARSALNSSEWTGSEIEWYESGVGYHYWPVATYSYWADDVWSGSSSSYCHIIIQAMRFDMSAFVGRTLTSVTVNAGAPALYSPVTGIYLSLYTQSGDTPPTGVSWIPSGVSLPTGGNASLVVNCSLVLSNYLFVIPWIPDHECPTEKRIYPTYYENAVNIGVSPMGMTGV